MTDSVTLSGPGIEPIHTTLDSIKRAADRLNNDSLARNTNGQLKSIVERIERLEEEKKSIADDIRDIYAESKGNGFDIKALRSIIRLRKKDPNERQEEETILETYMHALGMI